MSYKHTLEARAKHFGAPKQLTQGISLASVIVRGGLELWHGLTMVLTYSLTCPVGIAVGMAIASSYDAESEKTRAIQVGHGGRIGTPRRGLGGGPSKVGARHRHTHTQRAPPNGGIVSPLAPLTQRRTLMLTHLRMQRSLPNGVPGQVLLPSTPLACREPTRFPNTAQHNTQRRVWQHAAVPHTMLIHTLFHAQP